MTQFKLKLTNVKHAPRKTQLVANLIRKRSVDDALIILEHTPKRAVDSFIKILKNCQATARNVHKLMPESLMIDEVFATGGMKLVRPKKIRRIPKKRGNIRYMRQIYQRSHIFVTISGQSKPELNPKKNASQQSELKEKKKKNEVK